MDRVNQAFKDVSRAEFLPEDAKPYSEMDMPLRIGYGQTNSQPTTVRMMLEWLDPHPGEKILDIGSGSGWTTALLSSIVGPKGKIVATEIVPELIEFGSDNTKRLNIKDVEFHQAKKDIYGWPKSAPYDRILVSAAAENFPEELLDQLKVGGRVVIPVKNSIYVIDKTSKNDIEKTEHPGFVFVPLI